MKKVLLVMGLVCLLMGISQATTSHVVLKWNPVDSFNWRELTYDCNDPHSSPLADGTKIIVMQDVDQSSCFQGVSYTEVDHPVPVGTNGLAGEIWPTNEYELKSGSFDFTITFLGDPPPGYPPPIPWYYLLIVCNDANGSHPLYCSYPFIAPYSGDIEYVISCPIGAFDNPCWTCLNTCEEMFTCDQDTLFLPWEPWGNFCIDLCADGTGQVEIYVGPFNEACYAHYPNGCVASVLQVGCNNGDWYGCNDNPECPPAELFGGASEVGLTMCWSFYNDQLYFKTDYPVQVTRSGCACIFYDGPLSGYSGDCWLPVELMSFTAEPTIDGIRVGFRTGSETDNDYFEILKSEAGGEFEVLTRLDAEGNGSAGHSYSYLDRAVTAGQSYSYKLVDVDISGERTVHDDYVAAATAISSPVPNEYSLSVYPNPFNPSTTVRFQIKDAGLVQLAVYDITGRQVAKLVDGTLEAGNHEAAFDAAGLPSGIYMARLQTAENTLVTKMVLMK